MKNFVKKIAEKVTVDSFTLFTHYQPKMPVSLMQKIQAEDKKD